jgi:SAM-dependent methyltransferase
MPDRHKTLLQVAQEATSVKSALEAEGGNDKSASQAAPTFRNYWARLRTVTTMVETFERLGLPTSYEKSLDIGCGLGVHAAIMKGMGLTKSAEGLDVLGRVSPHLTAALRSHARSPLKARSERYGNALAQAKWFRNSAPRASQLLESRSVADSHFRTTGRRVNLRAMERVRMKATPELDELITSNIYDYDFGGKTYDLMTSFASLTFFEIDQLFSVISSRLRPGGLFYFEFSPWWSCANIFGLTGDFPWAAPRLTREDYLRYVTEFHPEELELQTAASGYFKEPHPSMANICASGERHGLTTISAEYYIPRGFESSRGADGFTHANSGYADLTEVTENVRRFRPDVTGNDLLANRISGILVKRRSDLLPTADVAPTLRTEIDQALAPAKASPIDGALKRFKRIFEG